MIQKNLSMIKIFFLFIFVIHYHLLIAKSSGSRSTSSSMSYKSSNNSKISESKGGSQSNVSNVCHDLSIKFIFEYTIIFKKIDLSILLNVKTKLKDFGESREYKNCENLNDRENYINDCKKAIESYLDYHDIYYEELSVDIDEFSKEMKEFEERLNKCFVHYKTSINDIIVIKSIINELSVTYKKLLDIIFSDKNDYTKKFTFLYYRGNDDEEGKTKLKDLLCRQKSNYELHSNHIREKLKESQKKIDILVQEKIKILNRIP